MKNHICLVSPAQSKKNPTVSAKTVVVPFLHTHNKPPGQHYFVPDTKGQNSFVPGTRFCHQDNTVLSPGQDVVPGTRSSVGVWVFQVELDMRRNCIISQFGEFGNQYSLAILARETVIDVGTVSDSM